MAEIYGQIDPNDDKLKRDVEDNFGGVKSDDVYHGTSEGSPKAKFKQASNPRQRKKHWVFYGRRWALACLLFYVSFLCIVIVTIIIPSINIFLNGRSATSQRIIPVEGAKTLSLIVKNPLGVVVIQGGGSATEVRIEYTKKRNGFGSLKNLVVDVETPAMDQVMVTVNVPPNCFSQAVLLNCRVEMTIVVPTDLHLEVESAGSGSSSIEVHDVNVHSLDLYGGTIFFAGTLEPGANAQFSIDGGAGVEICLPQDIYVEIDASASQGKLNIADEFSSHPNVSGYHWVGTLGEGQGNPPVLKLDTGPKGTIKITPR